MRQNLIDQSPKFLIQLQDGSAVLVITDQPKISRNYTVLVEFVNASHTKGNLAMIAYRDQHTAVPLEAKSIYRLVHESETDPMASDLKWVKTFEHLLGAVITGARPAGTKVTIAMPIMTKRKRSFICWQSNMSNGQLSFVDPYSTEGATAGDTNFDTNPIGAYQLVVG